MKTAQKNAVVVGALGVIGRYIVDKLLAEGDWQVVGLSRRPAKNTPSICLTTRTSRASSRA